MVVGVSRAGAGGGGAVDAVGTDGCGSRSTIGGGGGTEGDAGGVTTVRGGGVTINAPCRRASFVAMRT